MDADRMHMDSRGHAWRRALLIAGAAITALIALDALTLGLDAELLNLWGYFATVGGSVVVLAWGAVARSRQRAALALLAVGMGLNAAADVVWEALESYGSIPASSIADVLYLGAYLPLIAAAAVALRPRPGEARGPWLDGVLAVLALGSVSALLIVTPVSNALSGATAAEIFTALAYPVSDLLLLGVVVALLAVRGWRADGIGVGLAVGAAIWVLVDSLYVVDVAQGSPAIDGIMDVGWLLSYLFVATAAVLPERTHLAFRGAWATLPPVAFTAAGVVVLVVAAAKEQPLATGVAILTLVAVVARLAVTVHRHDALLHATRRDAETDALTGLGNRRRLVDDLERACSDGGRRALIMFDLDGFKSYNDDFGHPAGDVLLRMIGERLSQSVTATGHAYRLGGDEFCALVALAGEDRAGFVGRRLAAALVHEGQGFRVAASHGAIVIPDEARTVTDALGLADRRMYACKHGRRSYAGRQTAEVLLAVLGERMPDLGAHGGEVGVLAVAVALRLDLDDGDIEIVRQAAVLHDVGKIAIPESILLKPGPLDEEEWALMRQHTIIGQRVLTAAPSLVDVGMLVRASHERWDGKGYPDGQAGEAIPLGARIIAVCDAFDAMVSARPYGAPVSEDAALVELRRCAGSQFDPRVVEAFDRELSALRRGDPGGRVRGGQPRLRVDRAGR